MGQKYNVKHNIISAKSGLRYNILLQKLYVEEEMSGQEISDYIKQNFAVDLTPRSVQRMIKRIGVSRDVGDAYRLAIKKGRMKWEGKKYKGMVLGVV
jgi:hypothetical protein